MDGGFMNPRMNQISPSQEQDLTNQVKRPPKNIYSKLFLLIFSLHLLITTILILFLTVHSLITTSHRPSHRYPPLLTSCACAAITALCWLLATLHYPYKTLRAAFWLGPLLSCALGFLLLSTGSAAGFASAAFALVLALVQSLYACWVTPRRTHAGKILLASSLTCTAGIWKYVLCLLLAATLYSCMWAVGVAGAVAAGNRFAALYVFVLLLSLAWTMQVVRNVLLVAISRVGYMHFARGIEMEGEVAFREACAVSAGRVCIGSVIVPVLEAFRGSARAMNLLAGDVDEFLFSCAHCFGNVADSLVRYGNTWGFVYVGVYDKGIITASADTWGLFVRGGLGQLVDSDLTGSFCFLCGVAAGGVCGLVGGSWSLVVDKSSVTGVTVFAFLIGYFMTRIGMAWPQACVTAYVVGYAENPQSPRFNSTIADRIKELPTSQA